MIPKAIVLLLVALVGYTTVCIIRHPAPPGTATFKVKFSSWLMISILKGADLLADYGLCDQVAGARFVGEGFFKKSQHRVKEKWDSFDGVPVKMFYPNNNAESRPGLIYYHGGGWTIGRADTMDRAMARMADDLGMVIASVDYPRRPEATIEELYGGSITAARFFIENSNKWDVDPKRIAIGGGSAGANIATAVSIHLRDISFHPMPRLQILLWGCYQVLDQTLPSYRQNAGGPGLDEFMIQVVMPNFIFGNERDKYKKILFEQRHVPLEIRQQFHDDLNYELIPVEHRYPPFKPFPFKEADLETWNNFKDTILNPFVSPLLITDHSGLPDAYVVSAQYDPVRDDSFLYASKLRKSGVNVTHVNDPVGFHSNMMSWELTQETDYAMTTLIDFLRSSL